ncbi:ribonuclease III [Eremomyces bilateralis CBS 781.70]|uniref:Large ribosomal subunit protein mL44 n=1 Tax=Eremomyces bilateralis CBS 781.70 TaxID=1392243 RepID=A0A6G1G0P4_9PEZI|nr:ribonuclease III [Eremomyces bilateralis CBS 781.70]KAF1811552.1 ribonuclease III [Eremomyces bilateralis CBS 781.70]
MIVDFLDVGVEPPSNPHVLGISFSIASRPLTGYRADGVGPPDLFMKPIRLRTQVPLYLRSPSRAHPHFLRSHPPTPFSLPQCRRYSAYAAQESASNPHPSFEDGQPIDRPRTRRWKDEELPSPLVQRSLSSPKLSALHARLSLPSRFPIQTLARALVTPSADPNPQFNNAALETLGSDLLGYYTSEYLLCHYPRIPIAILFAAQSAYVGSTALATIAKEWGVETAAHPGGEVDPGLLQHLKLASGEEVASPEEAWGNRRRTLSSRVLYDDQFGDLHKGVTTPFSNTNFKFPKDVPRETISNAEDHATGAEAEPVGIPVEDAYKSFVRALIGALYLHCGPIATKRFFQAHFLSRRLDVASLFQFRHPQRELAILCGREGFEAPVARLISETGRLSRHPVYVVGVYSGKDKLGEAAGASLMEARVRAAAAALKSWYLYSPLEVTLPSETEHAGEGFKWSPNMVDYGEVFV